jgi:iron(III) transport system ATP-binding protein
LTTITLEGLWKRFGSFAAIRGADLRVNEGEFVTLLGESGCGKTTTLRCLAGLETPSSGRIAIGGTDVFNSATKIVVPPEKRDVGMVFQSYALWPHMTVGGNVGYPLKMRKLSRADTRARVGQVLELVGLAHLADRPASALSGGQQQRVALARAIVARPGVILYDEPLSNLDPSLRRSMRDEIQRLHQVGGTTSVYVTHDLEEAMHLSDRIVIMQSGLLEQIATPSELSERPRTEFVARFVGFENVLDATVLSQQGDLADVRVSGLGVLTGVPVTGQLSEDSPRARFAARGSNLELVSDSAEEALSGVVESVIYLGGRVEYTVQVGGESVKVVRTEGVDRQSTRTQPGGRVGVRVHPELCALVPHEDATTPVVTA